MQLDSINFFYDLNFLKFLELFLWIQRNPPLHRNLGDTKGDNRNKKEREITQVIMKSFPMSLATLTGNRTEAAEMRAYWAYHHSIRTCYFLWMKLYINTLKESFDSKKLWRHPRVLSRAQCAVFSLPYRRKRKIT